MYGKTLMDGLAGTTRRRMVLLCLTLSILFSCDRDSSKDGLPVKVENVVIAQWGQEKYLIYLPVYVAMERGYFKEQGIEVTLRFSGNDDQVFASVLQGSAQFGVGDPVFTAIANEKGGDLGRVVASIVDGVAIWGVTNKEAIQAIRSPAGLAGLRVGTFPSPSTNYTLMKKTIVSGGDALKSTRIVEAPIGGQIALLESGAADIAMVLEPAASMAEAKGYRVVFSSPGFYGPFAFTGLTVSTAYLNTNRDIVQRMVTAIQQALDFCHRDAEGAASVAAKLFPTLDKAVVASALRRMISENTVPKSALVTKDAWLAATSARVTVGDLKSADNYTTSVEPSFAKKATKPRE